MNVSTHDFFHGDMRGGWYHRVDYLKRITIVGSNLNSSFWYRCMVLYNNSIERLLWFFKQICAFTVTCPTCRKIYSGRIEDLPNNFILLQLLDFLNQTENDRQKSTCQVSCGAGSTMYDCNCSEVAPASEGWLWLVSKRKCVHFISSTIIHCEGFAAPLRHRMRTETS